MVMVPSYGYFTDAQIMDERDRNELRVKCPVQDLLFFKNNVRRPPVEHLKTAGKVPDLFFDTPAGQNDKAVAQKPSVPGLFDRLITGPGFAVPDDHIVVIMTHMLKEFVHGLQ